MKASGKTVDEILTSLPEDRVEPFNKLHEVIIKNLPKGFEPAMSYGGLGYVVPHKTYPAGYHCNPAEPLPFAGIALQKGSINLYHMGIYADRKLLKWFQTEYPKHSKQKLDMGKSCIRFKKMEEIPYKLIGELMKKITVKDWIETYEKNFHPDRKNEKVTKSKDTPKPKDGDRCSVIGGTHKGKSGRVADLKVSKTGQLTITVVQDSGVRFKTLAKNVSVLKK